MEKKEISELLFRAEKARKLRLRGPFLELGLTLGQGQPRILNNLLAHDHISQKELAGLCHLDVTTMSRTLDRMEEAGFLTRERDPACRRACLVCLTEKGREKAREVHRLFQEVDDIIWDGFSEAEMEAFGKTLRKVCENLEQDTP